MSRTARVLSATGYYHIIMRGNNKACIFEKNETKVYFMKAIKKVEAEGFLDLAAWCIMDNHVHLVIKTEPEDLAVAFKRINVKFAMYYNRKFKMVGHVFQDRFRSEVIESDEYLMNVVRYVHNNPVKAMITDEPSNYEWSSYKTYIARSHTPAMTFVWKLFNSRIESFTAFHQKEDKREYLEIKEDQIKFRQERAQQIIKDICHEKGIIDEKEMHSHPLVMNEIASCLVADSGLAGRQIAILMGITESMLRRIKKNL